MTASVKIENPFTYAKDPELNRIFDGLISLRTRVETEFAKAEKIAGFGSSMKFLPAIDAKSSALPSYTEMRNPRESYTWTKKGDLRVIEATVRAAITAAKAHVDEVEALNQPVYNHNNEVAAQVKEIMTRLGVSQTYTTYDYATSRSRTKKSTSHSAGYLGDLQRTMPRSNYGTVRYQITEYERNFERWLSDQVTTDNKERIENDAKAVETKILGNPTLVATLMQAGVNILTEVQKAAPGAKADVIDYCMATAIDNVTKKSKYLKLGYALQLSYEARARPEAKAYVEDAIIFFTPDTDEDQKIHRWILNNINTWTSGIVFGNDATFTYEDVFAKANDPVAVLLLQQLHSIDY